jgi:predicted site-specific integrase-resolvase
MPLFTGKGAAADRSASALTITGDLISRAEVAKEFEVSQHTLRKWEISGQGPPTIRVGRKIFYRAEAVRHWLLEREAKTAIA